MFFHVESCLSRKQSQKTYCKQKGLALSTFQYWAKKYREEFSKVEDSEESPGFIPVQVQPDPEAKEEHTPGQLHFLFPNGIKVKCSENVSAEVLNRLLNL